MTYAHSVGAREFKIGNGQPIVQKLKNKLVSIIYSWLRVTCLLYLLFNSRFGLWAERAKWFHFIADEDLPVQMYLDGNYKKKTIILMSLQN